MVFGVQVAKERSCGKEIENVKKLGVEIETDVVIGKSVTIDGLIKEEGYEAVFVVARRSRGC